MKDCSDCVSGDSDCLVCFVEGQCLGSFLGTLETDDAEDCLEVCQDTDGCGWFSYDSSDGLCLLTADCQEVDEGCGSCVAGQVECDGGGEQGEDSSSSTTTATSALSTPTTTVEDDDDGGGPSTGGGEQKSISHLMTMLTGSVRFPTRSRPSSHSSPRPRSKPTPMTTPSSGGGAKSGLSAVTVVGNRLELEKAAKDSRKGEGPWV